MNPVPTVYTSLLTPSTDDSGEHRQKQRSKRGGCKYPFPQRLFDLLEYIDLRSSELSRIISWYPNGKAFQVHDRKVFEKQIQPKMFNQSKYASFNRQLNLWGFKRIASSHSGGPCYFHPLFQRYDRSLCCTMHRSKGSTIVSGERARNFHSTSFCVTARTRSYQLITILNTPTTPTSSSMESRLRRTEQLLGDKQQQQGHVQDSDTNAEDSSSTSDDQEFQDLLTFLAEDDNILEELFK